jgi:hypothetical protein
MNAPLGILMLDTSFDRPTGDAGNPASWPFPVVVERVAGAQGRAVVEGSFQDVTPFVTAGERLIDQGAVAIITTCGFLVRHQQAIAAALPVPVLTSPLTQYQRLRDELPGQRRLVILTIDAHSLDGEVRRAARIDADALAFALRPDSHFTTAILDGTVPLDVRRAEREWVELACRVQRDCPDVGAWLFECANMPPYSAAVAGATGLAVYDTLNLGRELRAACTAP